MEAIQPTLDDKRELSRRHSFLQRSAAELLFLRYIVSPPTYSNEAQIISFTTAYHRIAAACQSSLEVLSSSVSDLRYSRVRRAKDSYGNKENS